MDHNYEINYKNITIKISDGTIFTGKINIMAFNRLSDFLRSTNYLFITVLVEGPEGMPNRTAIINRDHIIWADTWD